MNLQGKILITGGTGSLGTAILKRAQEEKWDAKITVLARNETKMNVVCQQFPKVHGEVGDIRDADWLRTIFPGHDTIIHAGAAKIVPLLEANPREAVLTNILGSLNVAQAAIESKVKRVIGISSDKAAGPTFYGVSKRMMEGLFRQANSWGKTEFSLCRYGNVLRSNNSVVPLFERQVREKIPLTVTDFRMTRFFLSMKQAIDLILHTYEWAAPGDIIVPEAPAMRVVELAEYFNVGMDVDIVETGIRPGERLHETLIVREEAMYTERQGDIDGLPLFVIHSPGGKGNLAFQEEYTSDCPEHWITWPELTILLENS